MVKIKPANEYYRDLPKKRISAGCLLFNDNGELLIVKTTYKNHWSIPGGTVNADEPPREACQREVKEEIGLIIKDLRFVCVDYFAEQGEKSEAIHFIFTGQKLTETDIDKIHLAKGEIEQCRFVVPEKAVGLLSKNFMKRLPRCIMAIRSKTAIYLENGN